jgi:hypothetical protein
MPPAYTDKLRELHKERQRILDQIQQCRVDLDRVDWAIRFLDEDDDSGRPSDFVIKPASLSETKKGSIRGLRSHIIELLTKRGHVMTASEMATEMYAPDLNLTPDQLRRRLSVQTSAMYKAVKPPELLDSGRKNDRREIYWGLPQWFNDGKIDIERVPDEIL